RLAWHWWDIVRSALKRLWKSVFGGDPVDLATGIFSVDKTDLVLPGRIPIAVSRSYRSDDTRQGFFGIGWNVATYDSRLTTTATSHARARIRHGPARPPRPRSNCPLSRLVMGPALPLLTPPPTLRAPAALRAQPRRFPWNSASSSRTRTARSTATIASLGSP